MKRLTSFFFIVLLCLTVTPFAHGGITGVNLYIYDEVTQTQTPFVLASCSSSLATLPVQPGQYTCPFPALPSEVSFQISNYGSNSPAIVIYDGGGTYGNYIDIQYAAITANSNNNPIQPPQGQIVASVTFSDGLSNDDPNLSRSCVGKGEYKGWSDFNGSITPTGSSSSYVLDIQYTFPNSLQTACGGTLTSSGLTPPFSTAGGETITYTVSFTMTGTASSAFFDINGVDQLTLIALNGAKLKNQADSKSNEPPDKNCPVPGYQQPLNDKSPLPTIQCATALISKESDRAKYGSSRVVKKKED